MAIRPFVKHWLFIFIAVVAIFAVLLWFESCAKRPVSTLPAPPPRASTCDPTLWSHTYHGQRFATAKDRLTPLSDCVTVSGVLHFVRREADGDVHMLLALDDKYASLPNSKNKKGTLVVESECERDPKQEDTVEENVCKDWHQHLYSSGLNGRHVVVTGAYVEDRSHGGWREIHPVTSIVVQ